MNTRFKIICVVISVITVIFLFNLVKIQLISDKNYFKDKTQSKKYEFAKHGSVFDRNGVLLWSKQHIENSDKEIYFNSHLNGLTGILNSVVRAKATEMMGQKGISIVTKKTKKNSYIDETEEIPSIDGKDVYLSIDLRIQEIVENVIREYVPKFEASGASVLVADPRTGQILAMTNFNPNSNKYEGALYSYEPGSIFKVITASVALENGIDPDKIINTENGKWQVTKGKNEKIIRDTHPLEKANMKEAMINSSNIAFGKYVVEEIGYEKFFYGVKKFAINENSDIPLNVIHKGFNRVPDARTQAAQGFGQSIDLTSLDIVKAFSAIANGGILYNPKLILEHGKKYATTERDSVRRVINSTKNVNILKDMLKGVVEKVSSLESSKSKYSIFEFAGKTGTAQMINTDGKYTHEQYNSSFIGMERASDPNFICLVTMYNTKKAGATAAGPVFREIIQHIYLHPDLSPKAFAREYAPADSLCNDISFIGHSKTAVYDKASAMHCNVRFDDENKNGTVVAQTIKKDSTGEYLELSFREHQRNTGLMPDVRGLTLKDAMGMLEHVSSVVYEGFGKVYMQNPEPGSYADRKSVVSIKLRE